MFGISDHRSHHDADMVWHHKDSIRTPGNEGKEELQAQIMNMEALRSSETSADYLPVDTVS
jgi:hypothetical protein